MKRFPDYHNSSPLLFIRGRLFAHRGWSFITRAWLRLIWPENPNAMPK